MSPYTWMLHFTRSEPASLFKGTWDRIGYLYWADMVEQDVEESKMLPVSSVVIVETFTDLLDYLEHVTTPYYSYKYDYSSKTHVLPRYLSICQSFYFWTATYAMSLKFTLCRIVLFFSKCKHMKEKWNIAQMLWAYWVNSFFGTSCTWIVSNRPENATKSTVWIISTVSASQSCSLSSLLDSSSKSTTLYSKWKARWQNCTSLFLRTAPWPLKIMSCFSRPTMAYSQSTLCRLW